MKKIREKQGKWKMVTHISVLCTTLAITTIHVCYISCCMLPHCSSHSFHLSHQPLSPSIPLTNLPHRKKNWIHNTAGFSIQSVSIIHRFCICRFAYLLKFICNPQVNPYSALVIICKTPDSLMQLRCVLTAEPERCAPFLVSVLFL